MRGCNQCNWSNTSLLNMGGDGRGDDWWCPGCLKRLVDSHRDPTGKFEPSPNMVMDISPFTVKAADKMAKIIDDMVRSGKLDSRSALADARLNYGEPFSCVKESVQNPSGAEMIAEERNRQITQEGWTSEHDDEHVNGELTDAAATYIAQADLQLPYGSSQEKHDAAQSLLDCWPWDKSWWKPSDDPIRNLVKAGALIAAEIDRLQRKEARKS